MSNTDFNYATSFSFDGMQVISGNMNDNVIRLWDINTGRLIRIFSGHTAWVSQVIFSRDGRNLVSVSSDNTIRLWDITTGSLIRSFNNISDINSIAISRDGKQFVSGARNNSIKLREIASGREIRSFSGQGHIHSSGISFVCFSPNERYIVSSSWDSTIKFWDVDTGRLVRTIGIEQENEWNWARE